MSERYTPEQMDARAAYEEKHLTSLELDADESCNCEECKFERDERAGIAMLRQAAQDARDLTALRAAAQQVIAALDRKDIWDDDQPVPIIQAAGEAVARLRALLPDTKGPQ